MLFDIHAPLTTIKLNKPLTSWKPLSNDEIEKWNRKKLFSK